MHVQTQWGFLVVVVVVVLSVVVVVGGGTNTGTTTEAAATISSFVTQPSGKKNLMFLLSISSSLNSRMNEAFLKFQVDWNLAFSQ